MKRMILIVALMFSVYAAQSALAQQSGSKASQSENDNSKTQAQPNQGQAMQKIFLENNGVYDWGKVKPEQSPLKAKVKIFNKGGRTLHITKVQPGCGCTTAPLDKENIEPGDFATLDVSLKIDNYTGDVTKSITINSDDPERREETLFIKANIVRAMTVWPKFFSFNELVVGQEGTAKVVLANNLSKPITIKEVISTPQDVKVSVRPGDVIAANADITITATVTPKTSERLQSKLVIKTDSPDVPEFIINGWGNAIDPSEK